ncbi:DnaJ-domain-containing protein [Aaosphaeria arxii CBS 175.79]|uniref:DnaJ-domain-containing protein n=1 Tax=Aaosphaeria arxii CBS 175.79 TaxID=1450172 RepID=A0A6A5XFA3_9PLEO|nr:DnaJ-domain-containing protein [Aaosphaeria arxii CBS 175.79]KAF2011610.1 DnaJ-domain-containing protein [Aaosphaeria arxii CBS 175.79]
MGASQSTGGGDDASNNAEVKTSYYELLSIERNASEEEIKKAYRRKALELHPDRNYGDVERTTALFAEIQSAYQVLSDPQERAWYDAHEYDILRGNDGSGDGGDGAGGDSGPKYEGNMKVTTADEISRMMGRFRGNVKFDDSPSGFYGYLNEVFATLAKEEEYASSWDGGDVAEYPSFGHKDDAYDDVVKGFYSAWAGFATRKSFAWKDKYRVSEAPDRRVRRLIEKENKKCRDDGIREFNEAVRTLVQFVRKRDPRYTPNRQTEDERAKAQRQATQAQAARARAAHAAKMDEAVPEWATRRDFDDEEEEETEEESEQDHFECVACRKTFKSERQWEAHEKSKKHQKAVFALKKQMRKDNANLNLDEDIPSSGVITPVEDANGNASEGLNDLDDSVDDLAKDVKNAKVEDATDEEDAGTSEDDDTAPQSRPNPSAQTPSTSSEAEEDSSEDDEYASRAAVEARLAPFAKSASSSTTKPSPENEDDNNDDKDDESTTAAPSQPKLGKAALKRQKKAAKAAAETAPDAASSGHKCASCDAAFPSKTQLFDHLKKNPKHAAPPSAVKGASAAAGGAGGGKKAAGKGKKKK